MFGIAVSSLAHRQFDQRRRLEVLAEPRLERGLALADVFDSPFLLRHRQIVARNENAARPSFPQLPDPLDRRAARHRVVGGLRVAREQLGAVLRRVAGEDRVALLPSRTNTRWPGVWPGAACALSPGMHSWPDATGCS